MCKIMKLNAAVMAVCCLLLTNISFAKTNLAMDLAKENYSIKKTIANYGENLIPSTKEAMSYCSEKMRNESPQESEFKEEFVKCMEKYTKDANNCINVAFMGGCLVSGGTVCDATIWGIPAGVAMQLVGGAIMLGSYLAMPSADTGDSNSKKCEYKVDKFIKKVHDNPILYCDANDYAPCIKDVYNAKDTKSEKKLEKACRWANTALKAISKCGTEQAFAEALDICNQKGGCQTQAEYFEALDQAYNWL